MNEFKREVDSEKLLEVIRKALTGIGQPDFDEGTGLEKKSGLTNIKLKEDNPLAELMKLADPKYHQVLKGYEKTHLTFDCNDGHYVAKIENGSFKVTKSSSSKKADCYEQAGFDMLVPLTGEVASDHLAVKSVIEKSLKLDTSLFNSDDTNGAPEIVISFDDYHGAWTIEPELNHLLFNFLAKQMGFIRVGEAKMLEDVFMAGTEFVQFEEIEKRMRMEFEQTFEILKEHGHDKDNLVESNDLDNELFYVEKGDIQGCVYISQNNMFLVAKNTKTNVLKAWNTMQIDNYLEENIKDDFKYGDKIFDVGAYLQGFVNAKYENSYNYPFEFDTNGYRRSVDKIIENFERETNELIYDSKKGFDPTQIKYFNSLVFEVRYSVDLMTDEYDIEKNLLILTEQDINSPEYFIRRVAFAFGKSRAVAFNYLLMIDGNGFYWNGERFASGESAIKDYPKASGEHNYSPLESSNPFTFGTGTIFFNLPKNLSESWKEVAFEFAFYLKEWIDSHPEEVRDTIKEKVNSIYDEYHNDEVLEKIKKARS